MKLGSPCGRQSGDCRRDIRHASHTDMRALLSDPATAAGQRAEPTMIAVSGLLRELILALTGTAQRPGTARRLEPVTLDQPLESPEQPLHLPERPPGATLPRRRRGAAWWVRPHDRPRPATVARRPGERHGRSPARRVPCWPGNAGLIPGRCRGCWGTGGMRCTGGLDIGPGQLASACVQRVRLTSIGRRA